MTYFTGMIAPVPTANRQAYLDHIIEVWPIFQRHGTRRMVETWEVDIQPGKVNDLRVAVAAKPDESVVFTWLEWPDRTTADAAWQAMATDPDFDKMMQMPFDGQRMIHGGFQPVLHLGDQAPVGYVQGFTLAVPATNKAVYTQMASDAWAMFERHGCVGIAENWGVDVPQGKTTDFYRATHAEEGEVPLFSWTLWPDRATCDAAAQSLATERQAFDKSPLPFDAKRMMWGGFEPIFDSDLAATGPMEASQ